MNDNELMDNSTPIDESFKRLMTFAKNHRPNGGLSNMYIIKTVDEDGNITSENYGMNMMTDNGMSKYFKDKKDFPTNLYIGNGASSFDYTTKTLVNKIPYVEMAATVSDSTKAYNYPMYYDPALGDGENGIITCVMKYMTCYFPDNITNVTNPIVITEYGIGDTIDSLWTHSWVYNLKGEKTTVTKHLNEKLVIEVYLCYSYYEYLITSGWEEGRYSLITTMHRFMNRMYEDSVWTYKRFNTGVKREFNTRTSTKFENNSITYTTPLKEFTMYNGTDASSGYFDGFCQWYTGFMTLEPQQLDTPENIDLTNYYSLTPQVYNGFVSKFGHANYNTPFTQIDVTSVALFNHKGVGDDRWTNYSDFYNDPDHWYCETSMQTLFATPIYYSNNNTVVGMYVFQNVKTDDPIIELDNTLSTVYATNKYWDVSSWVNIKDFKNIPEEVRTARYWITSSNTESLNPIRQSDVFHLCMKGTTDSGFVKYDEFTQVYGTRAQCDNYEYGWYMHDNVVYAITDTNRISFNIGASGAQSTESMTFGKWLVTFNSKTTFYLTDMSDLSVAPTPTETTPLFATAINLLTQCYRTKTDTGLICLQSLNSSEAVILDLRNDSFTQSTLQAKISTAIWGTNRVAYIPANDTTKVQIYDYDLNDVLGTEFTIPEGVSSVSFMVAHSNFIWITDGSTYSYVLDIRDGSINGCTNTIPYKSNIYQMKITAVDDAMIMYNLNDTTISNARYIRLDNPTVPSDMSPFNVSLSNIGQRIDFNLRYIQMSSDGSVATLVLLIDRGYHNNGNNRPGSHNIVADFGQFLYNGTVKTYNHYEDTLSSYVLYGEHIMYRTNRRCPIMNFMPQRIIGTTKTIGTINNIKHVSGKLWEVSFTNIPLFGTGETNGLPPGKQN